MSAVELELMALRIQTWMLQEFNELASVQAIEDAMTTVTEPDIEAEIREYRAQPIRYEVTQAGRDMLKAGE